MKLLGKATLYYVAVALLFFSLAGVLIYANTEKLITEDIEKFLINREEIATTQIVNGEPLSSLNNYEQRVSIVDGSAPLDVVVFSDTLIYDIIDDQYQPYRQLAVNRRIGQTSYNIVISKSLIESKFLVRDIFLTMLGVFFGLLFVLVGLNLVVSRNLWRPFKATLNVLRSYKLSRPGDFSTKQTSTYEFRQLNEILERMTDRIRRDYLNLKEFTENASHEIQTPLAIVKSKTQMLMQSPNLTENQFSYVKAIYDSSLRLSRLNQGLLLLAKIENQQFVSDKIVNLSDVISSYLTENNELMELKTITVELALHGKNEIKMNADLAQIMVSNLLRNAINHSPEGGLIKIVQNEMGIQFGNSGERIKLVGFQMFERFQKNNSSSLGLGLAIVRKICDLYRLKIDYAYEHDMHWFQLKLNPESIQN